MADPSALPDSNLIGAGQTGGIQVLEAALQTVFTEGTVIGAFICLSLAIIFGLVRMVMWVLELQRARQWTLARESEAKRLLQEAERVARERRQQQMTYRSPIQDNIHLPGTVSFEDVMGGKGLPLPTVAANPLHPASTGRHERRSFVQSRSASSLLRTDSMIFVTGGGGGSGTAQPPSPVAVLERSEAATAPVTLNAPAPGTADTRRRSLTARPAVPASMRRLSIPRDAEQPASGSIADLRRQRVT